MYCYFIIIFYFIICCNIIKAENVNKNNYDINSIKNILEFKNVEIQHLLMVSPSNICKCHQRTIYFKYPLFIKKDIDSNKQWNITKLSITEKEYFVGAVEQLNKNIKSRNTLKCLNETLNNNNIIRLYNESNSNLYWRAGYLRNKIFDPLNKYIKYNGMLKSSLLIRKDLIYKYYTIMKKNFPNDFNYMPESYIQKESKEKKFKNYKISEDNLWLVKPKYSAEGNGIHFLKDINDVKESDIITKYISDPLLIDERKFDFRFYALITSHDPLKIYLYREGLVRLATDKYNLNLNDLDNIFKHLTNTSINKKNKKGLIYDEFVISVNEAKKYLEKNNHLKFSQLWEKIKDIIIKSFISVNHLEIKEQKKYNLNSNNLFELYGVDILIDKNLKPWLLEINRDPDFKLKKSKNHAQKLKYKLLHDVFNIIGIVPYSHINNFALEGECKYKTFIEEIIDQSFCEFTRPLGGFEHIFPIKVNIDHYKQYFKNISESNLELWNYIENENIENDKGYVNNDNELSTIKEDIKVNKITYQNNELYTKENIDLIKKKNEILIKKFPQFKNIKEQNLLMLSPSPKCKINQRTIFFKYPSSLNSNINDKVEELVIKEKEYFVGAYLKFYKNYLPDNMKKTLKNNGIILLNKEDGANLYWRSTRKNSVIPTDINKYQKYNHMLMFHEITRKHLLYKNYVAFKKQFPNDFNFMPETYTSDAIEEYRKKFANYKLSKDNLWLIKPQNALQGRGIRFLKKITDVKNDEIVTKYISNPLLYHGRKFDIRFHVLVTSHNPLKVYIHSNGWVRISSEYYDLNLENLDNIYKHVTNISLNKKNKGKYRLEEFVLSIDQIKEYLIKAYNLKFSVIEEEVKDIIIKTLITMNHLELKKEKEFKLNSNNLFDMYGVDIIIDSEFKPWLAEININPSLDDNSLKEIKKMYHQTLNDVFNILGIIPYSHVNGTTLEKGIEFKDSIDEAVQQSICEFTRTLGGFRHIFPLKSNIDYYKKFFKKISPNNQALWDEIQMIKNDN